MEYVIFSFAVLAFFVGTGLVIKMEIDDYKHKKLADWISKNKSNR